VCLSINRIRFKQFSLRPSVFRIHNSSFRFLLVTFIGKFGECALAFSSGAFIVPSKNINTSLSVSIKIKICLTFFYMGVKRGLWRYVDNVVWKCLKKGRFLEKCFIPKGKKQKQGEENCTSFSLRLTYYWALECRQACKLVRCTKWLCLESRENKQLW